MPTLNQELKRKTDNNSSSILEKLPSPVLLTTIASFSAMSDASHIETLTKPIYKTSQSQLSLEHFLHLVSRNKLKAVAALLTTATREQNQNLNMFWQRGRVTDYTGRNFFHITALQYAIWSRNPKMIQLLLTFMPHPIARHQVDELTTHGTEFGAKYDFSPIKNALNEYLQNYGIWSTRRLKEYWVKVIGQLEIQLPAHVAQIVSSATMSSDYEAELKLKKIPSATDLAAMEKEPTFSPLYKSKAHFFPLSKKQGEKIGSNIAVGWGGLDSDFRADSLAADDLKKFTALESKLEKATLSTLDDLLNEKTEHTKKATSPMPAKMSS